METDPVAPHPRVGEGGLVAPVVQWRGGEVKRPGQVRVSFIRELENLLDDLGMERLSGMEGDDDSPVFFLVYAVAALLRVSEKPAFWSIASASWAVRRGSLGNFDL